MDFQIQIGDKKIEVLTSGQDILLDGHKSQLKVEKLENRYLATSANKITEIHVLDHSADRVTLLINGKETEVIVRDHMALMLDKLGMSSAQNEVVNEVVAPMPGVIQGILVTAGQQVKKGDPLLILEAMKMENMIKAPADATIASIEVTKTQSVEKNATLIRFA